VQCAACLRARRGPRPDRHWAIGASSGAGTNTASRLLRPPAPGQKQSRRAVHARHVTSVLRQPLVTACVVRGQTRLRCHNAAPVPRHGARRAAVGAAGAGAGDRRRGRGCRAALQRRLGRRERSLRGASPLRLIRAGRCRARGGAARWHAAARARLAARGASEASRCAKQALTTFRRPPVAQMCGACRLLGSQEVRGHPVRRGGRMCAARALRQHTADVPRYQPAAPL